MSSISSLKLYKYTIRTTWNPFIHLYGGNRMVYSWSVAKFVIFRFGMKNNLDNILVGIIVQKPLLVHIVDEDFLRTNVETFTSKRGIIIRIVNITHRNEYIMAKVSLLEILSYSKVNSMESSEVSVTNFIRIISLILSKNFPTYCMGMQNELSKKVTRNKNYSNGLLVFFLLLCI